MPKLPNLNADPLAAPAVSGKGKSGLKASAQPNSANSGIPKRFLSVRVYRHYGAIDIEFGVSAESQPENEGDQQRLWLKLEQQVMDMHDEWALSRLPNISSAGKFAQALKPESKKS